jgi:hypothetical protein
MNLPFTTEQFLSVFEQYNQAVWPVQIFLNILGLAAVVLAVKKYAFSDRLIIAILAFLWLWIGIAYHLAFFAAINPGAYAFAALNVIQGIVFITFRGSRKRLSFHFKSDRYGFIGALLILYALVIYPILGYALGHVYPKSPTFGLPCPTTIFTFGLLLWSERGVPKSILILPFLWSLIGFAAALKLGIREDIGLLVAGIVGAGLLLLRDRKSPVPYTEVHLS